tara:strand:+ start:4543 stop:5244 length:702 start_codon:yes stop_codon:yes gene_type:complete
MENNIEEKYSSYFQKKNNTFLYPTEWIIKALLGRHNNLPNQVHNNGRALDIGFGDGRNIILLSEIGYEVNGIEIDERICKTVGKFLSEKKISCSLNKGYNHKTGFKTNFFDLVIASNSLYYTNIDIETCLNEVVRILKKDKPFVFNIIGEKNYLLKNSEIIENNYAIISDDPLGLRNGQKVFFCKSIKNLSSLLSLYFKTFFIGEYTVDHWNYVEHYYTVYAINDKFYKKKFG